MANVFFPSCQVTAAYSNASEKLRTYMKQRLGIDPIGCCRINRQSLTADDTAIVICNNCAAILEESSEVGKLQYVWEIIDQDDSFPFPDYQGEAMTIQDCWLAVDRRQAQDAVRSLLSKMNIQIVEQEENFEKTRFAGAILMAPCPERNTKLAPIRYITKGAHMFASTPRSPEEQKDIFRNHCQKITTDRVVCYCKACTEAITEGGKRGVHLLQLLFPDDAGGRFAR